MNENSTETVFYEVLLVSTAEGGVTLFLDIEGAFTNIVR